MEVDERGNVMDTSPDSRLLAPQFSYGVPCGWLAFAHDAAVLTAAEEKALMK